ncbi:uncharacterized protein LOC143298675 [Babylonia areolata]|uniref:uncharacterized protein LOC143298675 n=1 Tax=Babylonia areolata TaxID=304850 RepID=UPI003FCFBF4B
MVSETLALLRSLWMSDPHSLPHPLPCAGCPQGTGTWKPPPSPLPPTVTADLADAGSQPDVTGPAASTAAVLSAGDVAASWGPADPAAVPAPPPPALPATIVSFLAGPELLVLPVVLGPWDAAAEIAGRGDQPPVPPIREGRPPRPDHWNWSTHRTLYLKNRYGQYLQMWPNGVTRAVPENDSFCVLVLMSHLVNVVMKGYISDLYLCMNPDTYQLYTRRTVHSDCYMKEAIRNGTGNIVYNFVNCSGPDGRQCYLGTFHNGTMRRGSEAVQAQDTSQWLYIPVTEQHRNEAEDEKQTIQKRGWSPPPTTPIPSTTTPTTTTRRPVSRREQRRKRVRRWCRNLDVIVKRPHKYRKRCKHDCDVLDRMIRTPDRYMRRCLKHHVRRRLGKKTTKRKKGRGTGGGVQAGGDSQVSAKVRAKVQSLWPRRQEIFRRLRQLRRCNKELRRRKGRRSGSCSKRQLQMQLRVRAQKRRQSKTSSPSPSPSSSAPTPRSRSRPRSRSGRRRVRHERKRSGRKRQGRRGRGAVAQQPEVHREKRHIGQWTDFTSS